MKFGPLFKSEIQKTSICPIGHKSSGWWEHNVLVKDENNAWVWKHFGPYCGVCYGEMLEKNLQKITEHETP